MLKQRIKVYYKPRKRTMLIFLDEKNNYHRIVRRGLAIGALTALAMILQEYISISPEILTPILAAVLAMIDKTIRELKK